MTPLSLNMVVNVTQGAHGIYLFTAVCGLGRRREAHAPQLRDTF